MEMATHPFDGGLAKFEWPSEISAEEYEDFKDWLRLIQRKAERSVKSGEPETPESA